MTFVYWQGDIARRVRRGDVATGPGPGVRVRLLIDALGGRLIEKTLVDADGPGRRPGRVVPQAAAEVAVQAQPPLHRKVCVVDEQIGFTGGVGIAEEWCGDARDEDEWRDTHVRVEGPAVDGLQSAFIQDWAETGRPLYDDDDQFPEQPQAGHVDVQVVRGSASLGWDDMQSAFHVMLGVGPGAAAHRHGLLRARRRLPRHAVRRPGPRRRGRPAAARPHADKRVCQLASEGVLRAAGRLRRARSGPSSRR